MKIVGYSISNGMIRVITDNLSRPEFVYPADKFSTMSEVELEIEHSISLEEGRKSKKFGKIDKLTKSIDAKMDKVKE